MFVHNFRSLGIIWEWATLPSLEMEIESREMILIVPTDGPSIPALSNQSLSLSCAGLVLTCLQF